MDMHVAQADALRSATFHRLSERNWCSLAHAFPRDVAYNLLRVAAHLPTSNTRSAASKRGSRGRGRFSMQNGYETTIKHCSYSRNLRDATVTELVNTRATDEGRFAPLRLRLPHHTSACLHPLPHFARLRWLASAAAGGFPAICSKRARAGRYAGCIHAGCASLNYLLAAYAATVRRGCHGRSMQVSGRRVRET